MSASVSGSDGRRVVLVRKATNNHVAAHFLSVSRCSGAAWHFGSAAKGARSIFPSSVVS